MLTVLCVCVPARVALVALPGVTKVPLVSGTLSRPLLCYGGQLPLRHAVDAVKMNMQVTIGMRI